MSRRAVDLIRDEEMVTQYVFAGAQPRNTPRAIDHDGLSVLRGEVATLDAARFVRRPRFPLTGDGVRLAQVEALRRAGFVVTHTPTRFNPIHVSTSSGAQWNSALAVSFDACFSDVTDIYGGDARE